MGFLFVVATAVKPFIARKRAHRRQSVATASAWRYSPKVLRVPNDGDVSEEALDGLVTGLPGYFKTSLLRVATELKKQASRVDLGEAVQSIPLEPKDARTLFAFNNDSFNDILYYCDFVQVKGTSGQQQWLIPQRSAQELRDRAEFLEQRCEGSAAYNPAEYASFAMVQIRKFVSIVPDEFKPHLLWLARSLEEKAAELTIKNLPAPHDGDLKPPSAAIASALKNYHFKNVLISIQMKQLNANSNVEKWVIPAMLSANNLVARASILKEACGGGECQQKIFFNTRWWIVESSS